MPLAIYTKGSGTRTRNKVSHVYSFVGFVKEGFGLGVGTITWMDGDSYNGQWDSDMMHGTGSFTTKAISSLHSTLCM